MPVSTTTDLAVKRAIELESQREMSLNIKLAWNNELRRLASLEARGRPPRRSYLKTSCIMLGYAEKEGEETLFLFGNVYNTVLRNRKFQKTVKKVSVNYIITT